MTRVAARDRALIVALAVLAAYHVALTLSTVLSYGLVHPLADEFRLSYRYLTMPFPDSILALENGHRPVIPGLLRWIGLVHMDGSQAVQAAASALSALLSVAMVLREARRELRGRTLAIAAVACLAAASILWNANARMFVHANESAHVFIVTLAVIAAVVCAMEAAASGSAGSWAAAVACSVAATLSFGTGVACFGAVFVVAALQRVRLPWLAGIAAAAVVTLAIYVYVMPGADGVRHVVGTTTLSAAVLFSLMRLGALFAEFTSGAKMAAAAVGGLASVVFVISILFAFARRRPFTRLQVFALALFAFAVGANLVIAASRAAYFFVYPEQVFADRYLYWSCLQWAAMGLFVLASAREPRGEAIAALAIALFAVAAIKPAWQAHRWARATYEDVEAAAAALRLGLHVDSAIEPISDGGAAVAYTLVGELRRRHLCDFSGASGLQLGSPLAFDHGAVPSVHAIASGPIAATPEPARRLSAPLPRHLASSIDGAVWLADREGRIVGAMAKAGETRYPRNAARLGVPRFDMLLGWAAAQAGSPVFVVQRGADGRYRAVAELAP